MENTQVTLTLIYQDGTRFIVGGFDSLEKAQAWLAEEQTRPYWQQSTTWEIV